MNPIQRFFQEDIPATFSAGKWRIDLMQFKTRLGQLEKQRNILLGELGTKAWNSKVRHASYGAIYGKLEEFDGLVGQAQQEINNLQNKINQESEHLNTTNADFDTRLKGVQSQRQTASQKLAQLQIVQKNIQQRISQLQATVTQGTAHLQAFQTQIGQIQASDQVDKDAKIASLQSTGASVQMQINDAGLQINTARAELASNQNEQMPVKNEIDGYNQLITSLQEQNKAAVAPIQQQLKLFQQDLLKVNEKKSGLLNQISAQMPELGSQVYKFHPVSDVLAADYTKVDAIQNDIKAVNDQINLTQARLASVNSGSLTKVAVTAGGLVVLILSIFILAIWVVPTVVTLLTPDPKASIRLVQSWTLQNCATGNSSDGTIYDISVWENRKGDSVATVDTEEKLLGANNIVLASDTKEMEIAPGGLAISIMSLNSGGSRVQSVERSVSSVYFNKTSVTGQNKIDVKTFFEKPQYSTNIALGLEITNKTDFGLRADNSPSALVINKDNKLIDILVGGMNGSSIAVDAISKVSFQTMNSYNTKGCLQSDYTQEEVTFWYFVPLQTSTDTVNQLSVSGKAVYKP